MKQRKKTPWSLRWWLTIVMIICWIVPVVLVSTVAGVLINSYYEDSFQQAMNAGVDHAMGQLELRMRELMEDSKSVSYDGEVRSAYRSYQQDADSGALYRTVRDYLARKFSRSERLDAVFLIFRSDNLETVSHIIAPDAMPYAALQRFRTQIQPLALECAEGSDTGIYFLEADGELYMVRNILDGRFVPYATLVMLCDVGNLFQSFVSVSGVSGARIAVDDLSLPLDGILGALGVEQTSARQTQLEYAAEVDGHSFVFTAQTISMNVWNAIPMLRWTLLGVALMILPLLALVIYLFYRHISWPISVLVEASDRVQGGDRGYEITEHPRNMEFAKIYRHFNSMSLELKHQFERQYLEQQALQQAKVQALQSQIDPHFLNNTLEVINWQARMEGNDRVSAMLEALSTMLNASIGRDGRSRIPLRQELSYVDAYLYIIGQRLGNRLQVREEIDEALLDCMIPRLMIQPLVENAINHDIANRGGALLLRIRSDAESIVIDVEHDGHISPEDEMRIRSLLADVQFQPNAKNRRVGIRNVNQRIHLIYGDRAKLNIWEIEAGRILARIELPNQDGLV